MRTLSSLLIASGALLLLVGLMAESPAMVDGIVVHNAEFEPKRRPPVLFSHDAHNAAAGLDDCSVCHHLYEHGRLVEGFDSAGIPCADCHTVKPALNPVPLLQGYHKQCKGCHIARKAGPITCGECHVRRAP